jgi:hypothetical protein
MSDLAEKTKTKAKKTTELGLVSALTIIAQFCLTHKSDKNMSVEFERLRGEFAQIRLEREQIFAKKEDVKLINKKLDQMHDQFKTDFNMLNTQVADIKGYLKKTTNFYSFNHLSEGPCYEQTVFKGKQTQQIRCQEIRVPGLALRF